MRKAGILIILYTEITKVPNIECTFTVLILEETRGEKSVIRRFK
jgi:hypothetical protein